MGVYIARRMEVWEFWCRFASPAGNRIRFVCENLIRFPFGQYIVGNVVCWLSEGIVSFEIEVGVYEKFAKM